MYKILFILLSLLLIVVGMLGSSRLLRSRNLLTESKVTELSTESWYWLYLRLLQVPLDPVDKSDVSIDEVDCHRERERERKPKQREKERKNLT